MKFLLSIIIFALAGSIYAQETATIEYASSQYKTTAGAIGPGGIIATQSFDIHVKSPHTLILDGIIISGYQIFGRNMIIPPVPEDGLMKLKLVVTVHQKQSVWYNAELTFNGITVPLDVIRKESILESDPAVIMEVRSKRDLNRIIKFEFDSSSSVYNK